MEKKKRIGVEAFFTNTQQTLDSWVDKLTTALGTQKKEQLERQKAEEKKQQILLLIMELNKAGMSVRGISAELGNQISHATIYRYIRIEKKKLEKEKPASADTGEGQKQD